MNKSSWRSVWDLNSEPPNCKSGALTTRPRCLLMCSSLHYCITNFVDWWIQKQFTSVPFQILVNVKMNLTGLSIPTGRRQTSWLLTNVAESLNSGLTWTNPDSGRGGTWTQSLRIANLALKPLGHASSLCAAHCIIVSPILLIAGCKSNLLLFCCRSWWMWRWRNSWSRVKMWKNKRERG